LTVGKGTSDMMFPFAVTLFSHAVAERLRAAVGEEALSKGTSAATDWGFRTMLNAIAHAERHALSENARARGAQLEQLLREGLKGCSAVRDVRVFGLLAGIELAIDGGVRRILRRILPSLYLLGFLNHARLPLLAGFCQYEPHVLKLTPPLSVTADEIEQICETLCTVLQTPLGRHLSAAATAIARSRFSARRTEVRHVAR
jgi:adenosylmethionine-8-amino-7-oxononanoate aminotransferase